MTDDNGQTTIYYITADGMVSLRDPDMEDE